MHSWTRWPAVAETSAAKTRLNWDEWCAYQQRAQQAEKRRQAGNPFSDRELANLAFTRWLYETGRLVP